VVLLQEVKTIHYLFRYFVFQCAQEMQLRILEQNEGLQSLLAYKGSLQVGIYKDQLHTLTQGQFLLGNVQKQILQAVVKPGADCHLLNTYYPSGTYDDLLVLYPAFEKQLRQAEKKRLYFLSPPRPARHHILDAVFELLFTKYKQPLQQYHYHLKLKQSLFAQLSQVSEVVQGRLSTLREKEIAEAVRTIIEADIAVHYPNEILAAKVGWSESTVKRAFQQEYGLGMYEYLRRIRMHKAKELLLKGEQVKAVAYSVGMRPTNFTSEFQKYFGYKATALRRMNH
jgi:AraC-like DNA-binding protein